MPARATRVLALPSKDSSAESLAPDRIRALRGKLSRAAFARRLGVTPHTVYRWELPIDAAEVRRPRGPALDKLRALERGETPLELTLNAAPLTRAADDNRGGSTRPATSGSQAPRAAAHDDVALVLPAFERAVGGELRRSHAELVQVIAKERGLSPNARALARAGIAFVELSLRADGRAALLVIAPALIDTEAGLLLPAIEARVLAVAAMIHATADASLFDLGRVHAYAARVELLAFRSDQIALSMACHARLCVATLVGDGELVQRAFAKLDDAGLSDLPDVLDLLVEEFTALRPVLSGKATEGMRAFDGLCVRAEQRGYTVAHSRLLCHAAKSMLETLADPSAVLELARKAKAIGRGSRLAYGIHNVFALRVEIEALLRMGRTDEALQVAGELDAWSAETGLPALSAISAHARLLFLSGREPDLVQLARRLRECDVAALRPIAQAYASYVDATAQLCRCDDPLACVAAFERAEYEARGWPLLLRDVLRNRVIAHVAAGQQDKAREVLRRAQSMAAAFPSSWVAAHLRRLEGILLACTGAWEQGRTLIDSAAATFDLAKDVSDAELCRYLSAKLDHALAAGPEERVTEALRALQRLGLNPPRALEVSLNGLRNVPGSVAIAPDAARTRLSLDRLMVPIARLAVRGAGPDLILRELMSIVGQLFPDRSARLERIDAAGSAHALQGIDGGTDDASTGELQWHEFNDGAGRFLRLGLRGPLSEPERAGLSILAMTTSLALDAAHLRGSPSDSETQPNDDAAEQLPGWIAVSPAMRNLRSQIARLSASRATVIVTGESGTGKDVVARAIHDLSERAGKSYVAFNCASVPRDLFEGQLFGYRKGAFTGAGADHPGVIRSANGGTLFLDEIAELPLDIQPKLLRFLENAEVFPLGERSPIRVDVRVVAATHRNLSALVRAGQFREDLYYRLQVVPLHVEPLRERREDIPVLARYFVRELSRGHHEPPVLAPDALSALTAHDWPGNVRELRNTLERALAFSPVPTVLRAEHVLG